MQIVFYTINNIFLHRTIIFVVSNYLNSENFQNIALLSLFVFLAITKPSFLLETGPNIY